MKHTPEHIDQLLVEKASGTISREDEAVINRLIQDDELVREQWQAIARRMEDAADLGILFDERKQAVWEQVRPYVAPAPLSRTVWIKRTLAVAATVALLVLAGRYIWQWRSTGSTAEASPDQEAEAPGITLRLGTGQTIALHSVKQTINIGNTQLYTTDTGLSYTAKANTVAEPLWNTLTIPPVMDYKLKLADGTEVWLNSQSEIRFPFEFSGATREIYITGEAFLKVAPNANQPFIVHAGEMDIKVLGTSLNVNTYIPGTVKASLTEGSVLAIAGNRSVKLMPGKEATITPQQGISVSDFDETMVLAWLKGEYIFYKTPLEELARILPRWYNVRVEFGNDALRNRQFNGALYKNQPLAVFLDNLKTSAGIQTVIKNNVILIQ